GVADVTRWREDPVLDQWGSYWYIRDVKRDKVWSPTYQPCRVEPDSQRIRFMHDHASFVRTDDDVTTSLDICLSPECNGDIRRLTLTNRGSEQLIIEVTTFMELTLALPIADEAHPAFS